MKVTDIHKKYGISLYKITLFTKTHKLERDLTIKNQPYKWTTQDIAALKKFAAVTPSQKHQEEYLYLFYIVQRKKNKNYMEQFIGRYDKKDEKLISQFCLSQRKLFYTVENKWQHEKYMAAVERDHTKEEIEAYRNTHLKKMYNVYTTSHQAMLRIIKVLEFVSLNTTFFYDQDVDEIIDTLSAEYCKNGNYYSNMNQKRPHVKVVYPRIPMIYKYGVYLGPYAQNKKEWKQYITSHYFEKTPLLSIKEMEQYIHSGERYDPLQKEIE